MTEYYNEFKITATRCKDNKKAPWGDNTNHHRITVTNEENNKRCSFDFWTSVASPEMKSKYDVMNAFYCFVSDAISGELDALEFNREFGYEDPKEALRAWTGCKNANKKLTRIYDGDIYELANELAENYG